MKRSAFNPFPLSITGHSLHYIMKDPFHKIAKGKVERTRSKNAEGERKVKLKLLLTNFTSENEVIETELCLHLQLILKSWGSSRSSSVQQKFLIFYETLRRIYLLQHFNYKSQIKKNELCSLRANKTPSYLNNYNLFARVVCQWFKKGSLIIGTLFSLLRPFKNLSGNFNRFGGEKTNNL